MTCNETITPSTDTVAAPQDSGDDPFGLNDIPDFLRRTPGKTKQATRPRTVWHATPAMKAAALKTGKRYHATAQQRR